MATFSERKTALKDFMGTHGQLFPGIANSHKHFKDSVLDNTDTTEAENIMQAYEAEDVIFYNKTLPTAHVEPRRRLYNERGLTMEQWSHLDMEEDEAGKAIFRAARDQVKLEIPKAQ